MKTILRDSAASETVGTILLLAISIALAGVFALTLFALPGPAPASHATIQAFVPPATDQIVLEHRGGPSIPLRSLTALVTVDGNATRFVVGDSLASGWTVRSSTGALKTANESFVAGDQAIYTDPAIFQHAVSVAVVNGATTGVPGAALALAPTVLQDADAMPPFLTGARTASATQLVANLSEPIRNMTDLAAPAAISARDFTVQDPSGAYAVTNVALLGNGSSVALTVAPPLPAGARPWVNASASPRYTSDLAGNSLAAASSTRATDGVAPTVSAPAFASIGTGTASATWTSDEATPTGSLSCGPTQTLGFTPIVGSGAGTTHTATLAGLTDNAVYYCQATAADAAGNVAVSALASFTTLPLAQVAGGVGDTPYLTLSATPVSSGVLSSAFTVRLNNASGALVSGTARSIGLATNSTLAQFFLDAAGTAPVTSVVLPAGGNNTTFYYLDYRDGGDSVVSATSPGIVGASASVPVGLTSGRTVPYHLAFTTLPALPIANGVDTPGFTVALLDAFDRPVTPRWALTVNLSTNSTTGYFTNGASAITGVVLNGASSAAFGYLDTRGGPALLVAYANNTEPAAAAVRVSGPSGLNATLLSGHALPEFALLGMAQNWTAAQNFSAGSISWSALNLANASASDVGALANATNAVGTANLQNGAVTGAKLGAGAIDLAGTAVTGNVSSANGGTGTNSSAATGIAHVASGTWTFSPIVNNDIAANTMSISKLARVGTSGQALLSGGAGADAAFGALNLAGGSAVVTGVLPSANVAGALTGKTYNGLSLATGGSANLTLANGKSYNLGANDLTFTTTGPTTLTLPSSGTLLSTSSLVATTNGGTGLSSYALGDTLYANAANQLAKLPGNAAATKMFLSQTGTGALSAAPSWSALAASDIPSLDASKIASGTLASARLASNVALLDVANTWTQTQTFGLGLRLTPTPTGSLAACVPGNEGLLTYDATLHGLRLCGEAGTTLRPVASDANRLINHVFPAGATQEVVAVSQPDTNYGVICTGQYASSQDVYVTAKTTTSVTLVYGSSGRGETVDCIVFR